MQVKQKRPSEASITAAHLDWSSALVQVGKICALLPFIFSMQYWPLEDFMVYAAIVNKRPVSGSALSCLAAASKMLFTGSTVQPILPAIFQGAFFLAAELLVEDVFVEVGIFEGKLNILLSGNSHCCPATTTGLSTQCTMTLRPAVADVQACRAEVFYTLCCKSCHSGGSAVIHADCSRADCRLNEAYKQSATFGHPTSWCTHAFDLHANHRLPGRPQKWFQLGSISARKCLMYQYMHRDQNFQHAVNYLNLVWTTAMSLAFGELQLQALRGTALYRRLF